MADPFNLQRFLDAQARDYAQALREIKNGRKQSHWIWYIFPKMGGGHSYYSKYYNISGLDEAKAYYDHPVLRERLIEITKALMAHKGKPILDILPSVDARKVKACMTLFWEVSGKELFKAVLDAFYEGKMDNKTLRVTGDIPASSFTSKTSKTTNMRYHQNPLKVEHLDFLIVDRAIRYTPKGRFTEEDGGVIALYNFFGRWFSKQFIIDRINYINEVSQKEGKSLPSFMDADGYFQKAFQELDELYNNKRKAEENEDKSQIIDIDTEILLEINNLCHFNEPRKMYGLFKKYLFPDNQKIHHFGGCMYLPRTDPGNWGINLKVFHLQQMENIPENMLCFYWADDGIPHLHCFLSVSNNASYEVFNFQLRDCWPIQKDVNIDKILNYSGPDYKLIFRMDGDSITCCNPPLIRHKYRLMPLFVPGSNFVFDTKPEYFDKYYDLLHTGNWNARHAIERGGFNLNG